MKVLYLFRHGVAAAAAEGDFARDAERPLTDVGLERTHAAAAGLNQILELYPDVILSSPFVRARQTADICAEEIKGSRPVIETPMLEPGVPSEDGLRWLNDQSWDTMLLVGHMPDLSVMASRAISGRDNAEISMNKASACMIRFYDQVASGAGELEWLLQPRILRRLSL